jgi:hypothetical protein
MKTVYSEQAQALVKTGITTGDLDHLPLPGGAKIAETETNVLRGILLTAGVPGISASNGRYANLEAYQKHLDGIRKSAADAAVANWLKSNG